MDIKAKVYKKDLEWLKGVASITIDDCFVVKGIKIVNGKNGLFISMPNQKSANGEYKDIAFPISAETREQITNAIMEEYNREEYVPNDEQVIPQKQLPIGDEFPF